MYIICFCNLQAIQYNVNIFKQTITILHDKGRNMQKIYTAQEVADILRVGYRKVLELIKDGKIKSLDTDGMYRITEESLKAFMAGE